MIIYALKSSNPVFLDLIEGLSSLAQVHTEESSDTLLSNIYDCDAVLFDLDENQKLADKLTKRIRKTVPDLPVFVLCNEMDSKKLAKHQNSRTSPDLYFRWPTEPEVLQIMLSEYFDEDERNDTQNRIMEEHVAAQKIPTEVKNVSNNIDSAFEDAFPEEFMGMSMEEQEAELNEANLSPAEISDDTSGAELMEEFDLGDDLMDLGGSDEMDEIEATEESVDSQEDHDDGFTLGDMNIDDLDSSEEESVELSAEEEVDDEKLPSSEDLEFPDVEEITKSVRLEMDGEGGVADIDTNQDDALDLAGDSGDELQLGEELELGDDGSNELQLGEEPSDELQLGEEPNEELELGDDSAEDFQLGTDTDDELELADDSAEDFQLSTESGDELDLGDNNDDDLAIEMSDDEEVDENFDPFASDVEDSPAIEASESSEDSESLEFSDDSEQEEPTEGGFKVEEGVLDDGELAALFGNEEESEESFEIEHKEGTGTASPTIPEKPLDQEPASFMEASDDDSTPDETSTAVFVDESTMVSSGRELPQTPPDFTSTIKARIDEIDAMVDDEEDSDEATLVSQMPTPDDLKDQQESEEATRVFQVEEPTATNIQSSPAEEETKVYNAQDLINEIESEVGSQDEVVIASKVSRGQVSEDEKAEYREFVRDRDEELMRMGETIKSLRADREGLMDKISRLEETHDREKRDFLDLQAELDERKIELEILKKRYSKEFDDLKFRLDLATDKKEVLAAKNKQYEQEFEKLRREKNVDVNRVRARERELEEKLELLKRDTEVQIRNRDHKILELKRRIDTLEFDIENAHIRERKKSSDQEVLEDRMDKVIKTLRTVIGQLEDDSIEERAKLIKKNLDV